MVQLPPLTLDEAISLGALLAAAPQGTASPGVQERLIQMLDDAIDDA